MGKLTKEQLSKASVAFRDTRGNDIKTLLEAAALYLQYPIDEPTEKEINKFEHDYVSRDDTCRNARIYALRQFISGRNAAPLPKPVDPRREAIMKALNHAGYVSSHGLADRIIAKLDEIK